MALQKKHQENFHGKIVEFENCYFKISSIKGDKETLTFSVDTMSSKDGSIIKRFDYSFNPSLSGDNFIAQGYKHLKTMPEFAGATDC
jgi:hypothetical protein